MKRYLGVQSTEKGLVIVFQSAIGCDFVKPSFGTNQSIFKYPNGFWIASGDYPGIVDRGIAYEALFLVRGYRTEYNYDEVKVSDSTKENLIFVVNEYNKIHRGD
jgi:hypothetical protein